jgi:hypothetical protein
MAGDTLFVEGHFAGGRVTRGTVTIRPSARGHHPCEYKNNKPVHFILPKISR